MREEKQEKEDGGKQSQFLPPVLRVISSLFYPLDCSSFIIPTFWGNAIIFNFFPIFFLLSARLGKSERKRGEIEL